MKLHKTMAALLLVLPLAIVPAACSDKDNRDAVQDEELDRDLNMALKGDSAQGVFEDTTQGMAPDNTTPPQPAPRYNPTTRSTRNTPRPSPTPSRTTTSPSSTAPRTVTRTAPAGTNFAITLNETLSTRTNSAGDAFTGTLQEPIMDAEGNVLIPAGATVRGRVTGVKKSGDVTQSAVISLAFESISYGGHSYPIDATVTEAHPEKTTRQTTGQQAGKVAAGAAAGAVLGKILGKDTKSTIKGAVIGAAAGTAVAMGTADVDAVLKAGSTIRARLDGPISVRRTVS